MKKLITLVLLINILIIANGQNVDKKWGFGVFGGKTEYNGDLGNGFLELSQDFYAFGGLSLSRYISKSFDIKAEGTFGTFGYSNDLLYDIKGRKSDARLLLVYKLDNGFILKVNSKLAPYITAGVGASNIWNYSESEGRRVNGGYDFIYGGGIGLKYHFIDWIALQYQTLYNFTGGDKRDFYVANKNDGYIAHSLGVVFSFGAPRDSDKDGVLDENDKCPGTPAGVKVDANGCPIDSDKDGIADYLDKCPTVKGIAMFQGCPDTDGDSIQDSEDKCPTVKGLRAFQGCPDTDGDGIQDSEDQCPTVKGLAIFHGCPDTDGDGIIDSLDRCPNDKGDIALQGCPDRDKDGIADIDDKCPDLFGLKENKGCPEVKASVKKLFEKALRGIQFETGKDVIKPFSFPILDEVVLAMKENKEYNLIINGHTDDVGSDDKNMDLSRRRAESVKNYLIKYGVEPSRMKAEGFGETKPIADNKTAKGRALNRRVEFKVVF